MGLLKRRMDNEDSESATQTASSFGQDLMVVKERARNKLSRMRKISPLYWPSRRPVGRSLRVTSAETRASTSDAIDCREVLPERTVSMGASGSRDFPPLFAFAVEPARLLTDGSLFHGVLSEGNLLLDEVSVDYQSKNGGYSSFERMQRYPPRQSVGSAISLLTGAGGANNYGHWLYDVLPRIHLLEQAGLVRTGDRYLVSSLDREYQQATLRLLGIDLGACIRIDRPTLVEADRLAVSGGHRNHGRVEPWIPAFLRSRLMPAIPQAGLRLYVNRRDTKIRKFLNEERLETALAARGIESVSMADFDFLEKMRLYGSAELIVAPHGSGLANIAFCASGTRIVELKGDGWDNPWFEDVARAVDLAYQGIEATRMVGSPFLPDIMRHLEVDVGRVMDAVDHALG